MKLSDRLASQRQNVDEQVEPTPQAAVEPAPRPAQARPAAGRKSPLVEVKRRVHEALLAELGPRIYDDRLDEHELAERVRQAVRSVLEREDTPLTSADRARASLEVIDEILGYGPLEPLLRDPDISEIMVNGANRIFVEQSGRLRAVEASFNDEDHLRRVIDKIVARVGRRVDEASPMVDARLPDGSRVNAVVPPIALDGSALTIRKFAADPLGVADLIRFGTITASVGGLLSGCVRARLNILVSGGTGSGKTTTLNVLSSFIPSDERVVTIEDAAELQLRQEHVLRLESRPANSEGRGEVTIRGLVRNALRMRPDRIVVGEVRDGAALDMLQAMNTGHDGSLTTVHANTPRDSLARLETMVLMAGIDLPSRAIREQVGSALDLIIQQARLSDGTRRITHITEVIGMEGEMLTLQDLFVFDFNAGVDDTGRFRGTLRSTGLRPSFTDKLINLGIPLPADLFADMQPQQRR
jgi:pilus assembly protein CpaF